MDLSQAKATNIAELEAIVAQLATRLQPGMRIGLRGPLGAGKTTFVKVLARVLGVEEEVLSPTYLYHQSYQARLLNDQPITLHHLDLYRINSALDVAALDLQVMDQDGVVVIEWVDRVPDLAQVMDLIISFSVTKEIRTLAFDWKHE